MRISPPLALAAMRGGEDHRRAEEVAVFFDGLSGVEADTKSGGGFRTSA